LCERWSRIEEKLQTQRNSRPKIQQIMEIINLVEATTLAWNWKKPTRERANQRPQTLQSKTQISKRCAKKKKEDSRKDTHSE